MKINIDEKIVLPGGAGLVGQNLVARLRAKGYQNITVIDKHRDNLETLTKVHPGVLAIHADLSKPGDWELQVCDADVVVMLQAQIGGINYQEFKDNNITATERILSALKRGRNGYLIHVSSSVVESVADDFYTRSKKEQEKIVLESNIDCPILRPTLMFGWFDRKHLGWLARFMKKVPIFPIPGHGRYMRQPLYSGDFCNIIISCIERRVKRGIYNISGHEKIDYIDIIKTIKRETKARALIWRIPYKLFYFLVAVWSLFDKTPPFTTQQLAALTGEDEFEVTNWPQIFGVRYTPFAEAIHETFNNEQYSSVVLGF